MIVLHQFGPVWGISNLSPFCFKVENYLRLAALPFEIKVTDPRKAPLRKLPFIDDGGKVVADSTLIVDHLEKAYGARLDGKLDAGQRAQSRLVQRMVEEAYYFCLLYSRWVDDAAFALLEKDQLRPMMPPIVRSFVPGLVRNQVKKQLEAQGTGRHEASVVYAMGKADLTALSQILGDRRFVVADEPSAIDASLYGFLAITLWAPPESPLQAHIKTLPNLVAYCERMKQRVEGGSTAVAGSNGSKPAT